MLRSTVPPASVFWLRGGWQSRCLVLSASQFQHVLNDPGRTSETFAGHAGHTLSLLSGARRGTILQELCKMELVRLNPNSKIEEPTRGTRCNGAPRSASQAEYDFSMDGGKIRCKSAQLTWRRSEKRWGVFFRCVKLPWPGFRDQAPFDHLYLILFSPDSLHIIKHDLRTGATSAGKSTGSGGHSIYVRAAPGQECWQTARSQILKSFLTKGRCELVSCVDLSAFDVRTWLAKQMERLTTRQDHVYQWVPLNHMAPQLRGLQIERMAFEVDQILNPNCSFLRTSSKVDWVRGRVKVEIKHGQMLFNQKRQRWRCSFQNIKCASYGVRDCDLFDELWLAIYSPRGIHVFKHPGGQVRFSHSGLIEQDSGQQIRVYSSLNVLDVREALDEMLHKMEAWGCQPLATILW